MILETFLEKFTDDNDADVIAAYDSRCKHFHAAIKAIGDSTKHGECWVYPKVNKDGYGVTSVLHKTRVVSRLVLCLATGKPYDYHNENGEYMVACHKTPVICRHRNCCNPEHLFWETQTENCKRREAEKRAIAQAVQLSAGLITA